LSQYVAYYIFMFCSRQRNRSKYIFYEFTITGIATIAFTFGDTWVHVLPKIRVLSPIYTLFPSNCVQNRICRIPEQLIRRHQNHLVRNLFNLLTCMHQLYRIITTTRSYREKLCCGQNRRVRQRRIRIGPSMLCRIMQVKSMVARNK